MKYISRLSLGVFRGILLLILWVSSVTGAQQPTPDPEVSLSLRGVSEHTIEVGEPLRVAVRTGTTAESSSSIQLAPANGSWINATKVEILSSVGGNVVATALPVSKSQERSIITLDQEHSADSLWWFPAEGGTSFKPGDYFVRAKLVIRDGTGWKGEIESEMARLHVVAASDDPARASKRVLSRSYSLILEGELAKAAGVLDKVLVEDPNNVDVLALRAALSLKGGDPMAAQACIDRALTLAARIGGEPSVGLHELASRIYVAASDGSPSEAVATWVAPPQNVFIPVPPGKAN